MFYTHIKRDVQKRHTHTKRLTNETHTSKETYKRDVLYTLTTECVDQDMCYIHTLKETYKRDLQKRCVVHSYD